VVLFAPTPPSPDLPIEAVIEFLSAADMVVTAPTRVSRLTCCKCMFQRYVASVSYRCCKSSSGCCKSRSYVAQVSMAMHVCFRCVFQMFYCIRRILQVFSSSCCKSRSGCCIYMHVASVYFVSCKCFIWMLHMFTILFKCFSGVVASVSDACFKCFCSVFLLMLQLLLLYVSKVNHVLHMGCAWKAAGGANDIRAARGTARAACARSWGSCSQAGALPRSLYGHHLDASAPD
jgi:hypothetical protein